jgi:hypothetical protein
MFGININASIKVLWAAVLTAVALLAPSAGLVAVTIHEPLGWRNFLIAMVIADLVLCLWLGLACMLLGYVVAAITRDWLKAAPLLRFGGALALIFFTFATLVGAIWREGPTSGPPPAGGSGS